MEVSLKEPAGAPPKPAMLCHVTVYPIVWQGDTYQGADVFIDHCCKENEDAAEVLFVQRSNAPSCGRDPANFLRVMFHGEPIRECPFCGARIEVVKEDRGSRGKWF